MFQMNSNIHGIGLRGRHCAAIFVSAVLFCAGAVAAWAADRATARADVPTKLITIADDGRLTFTMHPPVVIMDNGGWQPNLFLTAGGALFDQSQLHAPPFNTKGKMVYHVRIGSAISRDGGATWTRWTHQENHDDVYIEGGAAQLADGTILMLDTYVMPGSQPDHGVGELWKSHDDLRTLEGPFNVDFYLPHINWSGSSDDMGRPHNAARLHRSIIEMPDHDLVTTMYTWFGDDHAPCPYMPKMMKTRTVVVRSRDHGQTWAYLATVAVDGAVGTEGFGEPVLVRVSQGEHSGRLLCLMRTGRDLYEAHSDDDGQTWSRPVPVHFPGIDIYDTAKWERLFVDPTAPGYMPSDRLLGAEVDPDLIEMHNGVLVCAVGVRTPEKDFTDDWHSPMNGDYLAFSFDGGDTWSTVVQFLRGMPTTQYIGIRELKPGVLYVAYDDTIFAPVGRTMGFQLEVNGK